MSKRKSKEFGDKLKKGLVILVQVSEDTTSPRNIRKAATEVIDTLNSTKYSPAVQASKAVSLLNEVLQDPNIPPYSRVRVWNVVSLLEGMTD